jgi:hypothetical protein
MAGQPKTRAKRTAAQLAAQQEDAAPQEPGAGAAEPPPPTRDRAPRKGRARSADRPAPATAPAEPDRRPVSIRKIHDGLVQLFTLGGLGASMFADDFSGQVVVLNAERLARAWSDLAAQNATVRKALEALLMGSAWGTAIGSTAMVAVPILARYGVLPPETLQLAAGQGVRLPTLGEPPPDDRPPPPQSFTPDAGPTPPAPPAPDDDRHPLDGSPLNGQVADDPTAPVFPRSAP